MIGALLLNQTDPKEAALIEALERAGGTIYRVPHHNVGVTYFVIVMFESAKDPVARRYRSDLIDAITIEDREPK